MLGVQYNAMQLRSAAGEHACGEGRCESCRRALLARFHGSRVPGVQRLVMRRTKHHVYYLHDERNAVVYIIAVWVPPRRAFRC
jgi:hypothetical protein